MAERIAIDGVELALSSPDDLPLRWIGAPGVVEQLQAAWMVLGPEDVAMSPRIVGKPGVGKTTLAYSVARSQGRPVYILQCTMDTRPEDLIVTPVLGDAGRLGYHASALVTAMVKGGVCILDEGNRMSEKSWASLAPLLDARRYVESVIAGIKIAAHPDFRVCVTMNDDASTFEVPEYIDSRLKPVIRVEFPSREEEIDILGFSTPGAPKELIEYVADFLQKAHGQNLPFTSRDGAHIARYAMKIASLRKGAAHGYLADAIEAVLGEDGVEFLNSGSTGSRLRGAHRSQSAEEELLDGEDFGDFSPFEDDDESTDGDMPLGDDGDGDPRR